MTFLTWQNIMRAIAIILLIALSILDYGLGVLAKELPKEAYFGLIAIALGIDIKIIRDIVLRVLSGGRDEK